MGNARNCINVLSSHVVVTCAGGTGTTSEIALALKSGRPLILLNFRIQEMFDRSVREKKLFTASTPEEVITQIENLFR